jgi:glycosyltransferase involved in cell wall biosynthesis
MKILIINKFLYPRGGAELCALDTGALLTAHGHEVAFWGMQHPRNPDYPHAGTFTSHVDFNEEMNFWRKLKSAGRIIYSFEARRRLSTFLKYFRPDVVHLNNIAHQLSPSILDVLRSEHLPAVMTMHDLKLVCPAYLAFVHGKPCERCSGGKYYNCTIHKCIKNSRIKSIINTIEMYLHHTFLNIYRHIKIFISPSRFLMEKVREMGFRGWVEYLPNFFHGIADRVAVAESDGSIVYFGRLSAEKGMHVLIEAMRGYPMRLKIIGEGPDRPRLENLVREQALPNVDFLGYLAGEALLSEVAKSAFAVIPSIWYENNPRSVLEAFALGKPVLGSRIGGIPELVEDGVTGLTFESDSTDDLRKKLDQMLAMKNQWNEMGNNARILVAENYSIESHYEKLMTIFQKAL